MTGTDPDNYMLASIVDSTSALVGRVVDDVFRTGGPGVGSGVGSAKDDFYDPSVGAAGVAAGRGREGPPPGARSAASAP
ncbi:hypothetical protein THAOC_37314, partial [Thalassiosira oceanica]